MCVHTRACSVTSVVSNSVTPWTCIPPASSVHGDSAGKNLGVGCHGLLQDIFPTQDRTQVSCTAGGFFTTESMGKPLECVYTLYIHVIYVFTHT